MVYAVPSHNAVMSELCALLNSHQTAFTQHPHLYLPVGHINVCALFSVLSTIEHRQDHMIDTVEVPEETYKSKVAATLNNPEGRSALLEALGILLLRFVAIRQKRDEEV
jgi:hypothetical protein